MERKKITLGHSPDPDDAFMFHALANNKILSEAYEFEHIIQDIQTLNERAFKAELDITALSVHAYGFLTDQYDLLTCGASVGDGYGPIIVARIENTNSSLRGKRVAVPGKWTTAFLVLKLFEPEFEFVLVPFDQVLEHVQSGQSDFGLVIHEGQLTFSQYGLKKIVDLGHWWYEREKLPLPLGVNGIRKNFPLAIKQNIQEILRKSIEYGLENRREAMEHALKYGRGLEHHLADQFVSMYVNDYTLDLGPKGLEGIRRLFWKAHEAQLIPNLGNINFVEPLVSSLASES